MRTFVVKQDSGVETLLDGRFGGAQAEAAMTQLKALNPDVDLQKLPPGTRLFVPDTPAFRTTATTSTASAPLDDFRTLLTDALEDTVKTFRSDAAARAGERADVAAALKSAAFKRQADGDQTLAALATDASLTLAAEEAADKTGESELATIGKSALAALAEMQKLIA